MRAVYGPAQPAVGAVGVAAVVAGVAVAMEEGLVAGFVQFVVVADAELYEPEIVD